jgi:iron(III) transport system substrate-binding protein
MARSPRAKRTTKTQASDSGSSLLLILLLCCIAAVLVGLYFLVWRSGREPLVVYCAHDAVYSEEVLREFERKTGIPVSIRFDTEATKSLGLVKLLVQEKERPRCDVFWNNELLGTMDLQSEGVLEPYKGSGFARIPAQYKDPDGHWAGFGARLRVYIVNTDKLEATEEAVAKALEGDLSRVAMAKPLYGTTLTHYSVLCDLRGIEKLKAWHADWRERGVQELLGNAKVKDSVAQGVCDVGLTDTDDYFVAQDEGRPVAMLPFRTEDGRVICIPNTVSIIKGTRKPEEAKALVDFLLSEECEVALSKSKARQIPLGPVNEEQLSEEVKQLKGWAGSGYPLGSLGEARAACLSWLETEY